MHFIARNLEKTIIQRLHSNPAVALTGPRQCGKSTLAKLIRNFFPQSLYLDLELPSDLRKLGEPELFFSNYHDTLICLDEIQRKPELFSTLRGIIDKNQRNGQFLLLGSASRDLLRQSSESLAGRISFLQLTPFLYNEIHSFPESSLSKFWLRGGYPRSFLAGNDRESVIWRNDFIKSFVERDVLQIKSGISSRSVQRLLQMCAHSQGQTVNYSRLGVSLGMSDNTVRHYLDLLDGAFIVRVLVPFYGNMKKRLVKSPKIYVRDSGLLHALLGIETSEALFGHPVFGSSWETMVLENILGAVNPAVTAAFYRTAKGDEMDLVLSTGSNTIAVECKASVSPELTKSMHIAMGDLKPGHSWIVAPVESTYPLSPKVTVTSLSGFFEEPAFQIFLR